MYGYLCKDRKAAVQCMDICAKIGRRQSNVWISVQRSVGSSPMYGYLCKDRQVAVLCLDICVKIGRQQSFVFVICANIGRRQSYVWISVQILVGGSPVSGYMYKYRVGGSRPSRLSCKDRQARVLHLSYLCKDPCLHEGRHKGFT